KGCASPYLTSGVSKGGTCHPLGFFSLEFQKTVSLFAKREMVFWTLPVLTLAVTRTCRGVSFVRL
ncbi:MAG: hypothetical protein RSE97_05160, partial [Oscillospiraceae bacterium]